MALAFPVLFFADDVVLLASQNSDIHFALGRFAAQYEKSGTRISTSKSLGLEELLPQVED